MALDHSILINLFIKVGLNIFFLPPQLSIVFVSRTSRYVFDWFYGGTRKVKICPTTWRNTARRSKMFFL